MIYPSTLRTFAKFIAWRNVIPLFCTKHIYSGLQFVKFLSSDLVSFLNSRIFSSTNILSQLIEFGVSSNSRTTSIRRTLSFFCQHSGTASGDNTHEDMKGRRKVSSSDFSAPVFSSSVRSLSSFLYSSSRSLAEYRLYIHHFVN